MSTHNTHTDHTDSTTAAHQGAGRADPADAPRTRRAGHTRHTARTTPVEIPRETLLAVESPGRYVGGEYGAVEALESRENTYVVALCFPDLYEIGMSNTAIKLLYTMLNEIDGVQCERVFAPAPDFEEALRSTGTPLYTLESRIPLSECDMIAFTVGYELSASNVLNVLDLGGVPIRAEAREGDAPVVIAGGPALINPAPFGRFLDGIFIGEAEGVLPQMVAELRDLTRPNGGSGTAGPGAAGAAGAADARRREAVAHLEANPHVWSRRNPTATRAVWADFGLHPVKIRFPVPSIRVVQDRCLMVEHRRALAAG